jgi:hypothetical protein
MWNKHVNIFLVIKELNSWKPHADFRTDRAWTGQQVVWPLECYMMSIMIMIMIIMTVNY